MLKLQKFIQKANNVHNNKYDYSEAIYVNSYTKLKIRCPLHGIFEQRPNSHVSNKDGCPTCGSLSKQAKFKDSTVTFIEKAQRIHGHFYEYPRTKYGNNNNEKVIITCKVHGDFLQAPRTHLEGKGCKLCGNLSKTVFSLTDFKQACERHSGNGTFYILRCFNNYESFYKVGITSKTIKDRYSSSVTMPYNFEIVQEVIGDPYLVFNLELKVKSYIIQNKLQYNPKLSFSGSVKECYSLN